MKQAKIDEVVSRILSRPSVPSRYRRGVSPAWIGLAALGWAWTAILAILLGFKIL